MKNTQLASYSKILLFILFLVCSFSSFSQRKMENINRGLVAISTGGSNVYLSWRLLGDEAFDTGFNVYRNTTKITATPITTKTNFVDASGSTGATYYVKPVYAGVEQSASETVPVWTSAMKRIVLSVPAGGTTPDAVAYTYTANDCSVGDLDGDGEYEIVLKWDPTNSKDNSQAGYTGNVFLDAYKINGTRLWRIDLGKNIRAGAHYTQFMVYDLDADGKAEVACRTAPNSKDGTGAYLSKGPAASDNNTQDYRNSDGYNLTSPEYLTVFNGLTGAEAATIAFDPARGSSVNTWGDSYGNRADRFLAAIAYLDGVNPSLIMGRGYYQAQSGYESKTGIAAYDFNGTTLTKKWTFWANTATNLNESYIGQGNHNISVADVDQDGFDELIYGSMTIDHNGTGKYSTGFGHGDALYVTDLDPDRAGLEVFQPHEEVDRPYGISFRDSKTGAVIWGFDANYDVGRAVSADVNPNYKGYESWASGFGMYSCKGVKITDNLPISTGTTTSINHVLWWDGDLLREIIDKSVINKYNYTDGSTTRLWTLYNEGIASNNGTKENPALTADILGDWREEVIMRSADNSQLLIFNSTSESPHKLYCLMHDPVYRCAVAWQNVGYNQPPQVGYYLGADMAIPVKPNVLLVGKVYEPTLSNPVNKSQSVLDATSIETIVYTWGGAATDVVLSDLPLGLNFVKDATAKTLTITGTPLVTGTYTVTTVGGTGAAVVVSGTITVLPNPPTLTNPTNKTQTVTSGTAITPIIYTWGGGATDASISSLPAGLLSVKDADLKTITIYGNPIASGTYTVTSVGGSGVDIVVDGTITVLPVISCLELIKIPIYGVPVLGIYRLILFDSTGNNEIKTLSNGYFRPGDSEFIVPLSEISSGSYRFKLMQGTTEFTSGFVLVP